MNKILSLGFLISLISVSCTDPNTIGLEVQPTSDNITISSASFEGLDYTIESEDSVKTDELSNLLLGEIDDADFGLNKAAFITQILLKENNTDLGTNPIVDSVILSYDYSGYYGNLEEFSNIVVNGIQEEIFIDSIYFSNSVEIVTSNIDHVDSFSLLDSAEESSLRIRLKNNFGQEILNLGTDLLIDNQTFLANFNGISVIAYAPNTMLYLNPNGSNSYLKVYYHNDEVGEDTLSLDFELGGEAARFNLFNQKLLSNLNQVEENIYIQSMAGYKAKIAINNIDSLKSILEGKIINKVTLSFDIEDFSQSEYKAHDVLYLSRLKNDGSYAKTITNATIDVDIFSGDLQEDKYEFNITRYFYQLLNNNSYTNFLYLLPSGAAVNANRTILDKDIILTIHYSQL